MNAQEQKIVETVESLADDIFDFTARLVAEPSTLENEKGALRLMSDELTRLGLPMRLVPIDYDVLRTHPGFAPVPWAAQNRWNVVSRIEAEPTAPEGIGGQSALFNGHLDVVSPEPLGLWSRDPFEPVVEDGWMYGRGAGDMKSGVAAMTYAAYALRKAGFGLASPLTLEAVIEEECSGNGALACRVAGVDAHAVLIPEPFGPRLYTAQVGVLWFRIDVGGRPVHVQEAGAGANALEKCFPLIQALRELEEEMNQGPLPAPYDEFEHPLNLNVGALQSGDWPSTVPASATLRCRMAYLPGQRFQDVRKQIEATVARAAKADPWLAENPPVVEFYGFRSDGHVQRRDAQPLEALAQCHEALTGEPVEEYVSTCTTDLRAFYDYGSARGCCYGPVAERIHGADERVLLSSVTHTAKAYALFAARWCGLVE
ncbi:ArgE/DapE family deacylase [Paucidesulfovibrio longus]|uniref:ArgE/DapE family deacylase n=1 Tax=Paucidesulfovibrio longus TaxID=889 RepID=UPI0003B5E89A|nr:ArgE/DapE family deacylase [Paucidesulfovibrio longus]